MEQSKPAVGEQATMEPAGKSGSASSGRNSKGARWGVLIFLVMCALVIAGGVGLVRWQQSKDILRDERIVGTEHVTMTVPGTGDEEDLFLIKLADDLTGPDIKGLLVYIYNHNRDADNDRISGFTLATSKGEPLWNLNDHFLILDGSTESIEVALWLVQQDKALSWNTDRSDGTSMVSIEAEESYRDLGFLREVMTEFPQVRAAIAYQGAPYVNLPAGHSELVEDVEKAIDAWCDNPAKYGDIMRFYVPDFTVEGDHYSSESGHEMDKPELDVKFEVSEQDPVLSSLPPEASAGRLREVTNEWKRSIIDTLIEEGRTVVPELTVSF